MSRMHGLISDVLSAPDVPYSRSEAFCIGLDAGLEFRIDGRLSTDERAFRIGLALGRWLTRVTSIYERYPPSRKRIFPRWRLVPATLWVYVDWFMWRGGRRP